MTLDESFKSSDKIQKDFLSYHKIVKQCFTSPRILIEVDSEVHVGDLSSIAKFNSLMFFPQNIFAFFALNFEF